jgi:hypothetical protein
VWTPVGSYNKPTTKTAPNAGLRPSLPFISETPVKELYLEDDEHCIECNDKMKGPVATNKILINRAIPYLQTDFLAIDNSKIMDAVSIAFKNSYPIIDLKLFDGERKTLLFVGDVYTYRGPDYHSDFPVNGWRLVLDIGHKIIIQPFRFFPHHKTEEILVRSIKEAKGFTGA